ncbi:MAG: hypothetical protein JW913_14215 [Chitinispirillaceae bacterium]|nr:hypothetical protein [Chitinispirillaceae bacterium]
MRGKCLMIRSLIALVIAAGVACTGGGVDVGNPRTGTVSYRSSAERVSGAMVILSKQGADPGWGEEQPCIPDEGIGICSRPIYFDTTYTDDTGAFRFDTVYPGSYVLVAACDGLLALEYVEQRAFQDGEEVSLYLDKPATVQIKTYETYDTSALHFRGVRVAGTGFTDVADETGEMVLRDVPEGELDLILYRSDAVSMTFPSLRTEAEKNAELYVDPVMPVSYWTPHPSGYRDPLGRPYVVETSIPAIEGDSIDHFKDGKPFDLRISFSHPMDAISTAGALNGFSDDAAATIQSLWWEGGNVLYVSLCVADTLGSCDTSESRFRAGVTYGVTIDTTAQTSFGVHFAHEATVRFIPEP